MGHWAAAIPPPTQHFIHSTLILLPFLSFMALKFFLPPSTLHAHLHSLSCTSIGLWNTMPLSFCHQSFYFACMPYGSPLSKHFYQHLPSFLFYPIHPLTHHSASPADTTGFGLNVYSSFGLRCKTSLCFENKFALGLLHNQYGYNLNHSSNSPCDLLLHHAIP